MNAPTPDTVHTALGPELALLIDRGVLSRAELGETAVELDGWRSLSRELVSADQAGILEQMLGLAAA